MHTFLLRIFRHLPAPARRALPPERLRVLAQFLQFSVVGTVGFLLDTATVYGTRGVLGLYGAGALAYGVAASGNWLFNRLWTFRGQGSGPAHRQWARFLLANLPGILLNRGTYAILVTISPLCARQPVFAVAAGSLAGMFINFSLSRRMVFR
ncbi:MAG: GtrA family protein [Rhodospirillales bacterium]|nr:GtrA family protein [Rhodospirillales bacterium]